MSVVESAMAGGRKEVALAAIAVLTTVCCLPGLTRAFPPCALLQHALLGVEVMNLGPGSHMGHRSQDKAFACWQPPAQEALLPHSVGPAASAAGTLGVKGTQAAGHECVRVRRAAGRC